MHDFKSRSPGRTACVGLIAFCAACNALLDNHSRELKVVAAGAGGEATVSPGAAGEGGLGGSENSAGEAGTSGASGDGNESPEGGAAGSANVPVGGRAGSPTGGTAGMSQGGTSQGGMPACTGCTPGATEPQTRACGICNAGKESGTRKCTPNCAWETSWSGTCSDHGNASNGCSLVKWCTNDAGRTECTLLGCIAKEAQDECRDEAASICGTVKNLLMNTQCP
ncbi:MAG TPA: hypothetical protein VHM25_26735 [Polyangiaceae bacterium]|jgi:hypothetical protein|nr:hypothetical protein [Polyangiaceae bacterium]